jgi:hypothetical protein
MFKTSFSSQFQKEIETSNIKKTIIVEIVYRPPHQLVNEYVKHTDILMTTISKENKLCYLMGYFNLDLIMKYHCHQFISEFLDIMYSNMFLPLITRPTRITSNTASLLITYFLITSRIFLSVVYCLNIPPPMDELRTNIVFPHIITITNHIREPIVSLFEKN